MMSASKVTGYRCIVAWMGDTEQGNAQMEVGMLMVPPCIMPNRLRQNRMTGAQLRK